jgi:hypothetical protein
MLDNLYNKLQGFVEAFTKRKFWKLYLAIICSLYCIAFNMPQYKTMVSGKARNIAIWNRINNQIDHPFTADLTNDPEAHEAKLTFRLVPPLIAKLLPSTDMLHRMQWLFLVHNICGLLFFYLLIAFAEANFNNRFFSFLLPCCFAALYAGKTFFCDMFFFFDGLAYLLLLISICNRNALLVFISLFLAFYTDERSLIGSGFVMLYHVLQNKEGEMNKPVIVSIILAIVAYLGTRFFMQSQLGMITPGDGINIANIAKSVRFSYFMLGIFTAFKSFWLILIAGLFYLKGFWPRAIYTITLLTIVAGGICVFDFSRSISYGFVGLLAVLFYLYKQGKPEDLNKLMVVLLITCLLNPIYDVHEAELFMTRSVIGRYFEAHFLQMPR